VRKRKIKRIGNLGSFGSFGMQLPHFSTINPSSYPTVFVPDNRQPEPHGKLDDLNPLLSQGAFLFVPGI